METVDQAFIEFNFYLIPLNALFKVLLLHNVYQPNIERPLPQLHTYLLPDEKPVAVYIVKHLIGISNNKS
jgi:hypothetical protein